VCGSSGVSTKAKPVSKRRRQQQLEYLATLPAVPFPYYLVCLNEHGIQEHLFLLADPEHPDEALLVGIFTDLEEATPQQMEVLASRVRDYSDVRLTIDGDQ
jgi:hypothetical protein